MFYTNHKNIITAVILSVLSSPIASHARPICVSPDSDSDGDGYGWENNETCLVSDNIPGSGSTLPNCQSTSSDSDGDGYGWENNNSCRVVRVAEQEQESATDDSYPVCGSAASDPDGDGYGWENYASCLVITEPVAEELVAGAETITDVVLITGQSNALGSMTTFDPILDQPVDRVYAYTDTGWQKASLRQVWDLNYHPALSLGDDPHNNFGFHFGKSIASLRDDRVIGIILATAPGEGICHWDADGSFYNQLGNKTLSAINALPHKAGVDGIIWHQGETDWSKFGSNDPDLEVYPEDDYYSNKLWALINNFRMETWFDADRPFICGETARSPINTRLTALNRDNDIWTACVADEGLPTRDEEQIHFSADGLRQLGANYADVYLQMTE